jgi:hypothetical protein
MAAWGYRISEKLVYTSLVTEASTFHSWRSWKGREVVWLITTTLSAPQTIQRRILWWFWAMI